MTTDPFTDAATSAYEDYIRTPKPNIFTCRDRIAEAYMDAAMWARDHLAAQEVTGAEVTAALLEHHRRTGRALEVDDVRAALTAARKARR